MSGHTGVHLAQSLDGVSGGSVRFGAQPGAPEAQSTHHHNHLQTKGKSLLCVRGVGRDGGGRSVMV